MQQKNPGAVVACIRQLDHMTGLDTTPITATYGVKSNAVTQTR